MIRNRKVVTHKFKAKPVVYDGQHFASKLEWQYHTRLELQKKAGEVLFFLRQVPFHLPGGVKYVTDFVVFYADGNVRFIDIKGMETAQFKAKVKMVEALYPVTIEVVKRGDFR
ncbi:hypothetical protein AQUSIP_13270 [Aquicella siphonis]|uniref:DUF1064 domain-containing protein n=1 Tax=Aquicella siphonis TaxID=254247 RepID=A0A5E4PI50_9COXI|nr:DUF1064 domain-containing protein [Aquicella siphonis]VVC76026.1 hypothetical protein AQUSIP_13270 [Aquicella siphonis]